MDGDDEDLKALAMFLDSEIQDDSKVPEKADKNGNVVLVLVYFFYNQLCTNLVGSFRNSDQQRQCRQQQIRRKIR